MVARAVSQGAEVSDRAGEEMDTVGELGGGVGQQRNGRDQRAGWLALDSPNVPYRSKNRRIFERYGTFGELRSELATGEPSARQTTLAAWLAA